MKPNVGRPIPHDSAEGHVTGQSPFIDDVTPWANELHVGFVGSPIACGTVSEIDLSSARKTDGVIGVFTVDDVDGHNCFGSNVADEPFLAETQLLYVGQPVVVIAAQSRAALAAARCAVKIEATVGQPVLTVEEAVHHQRFIGPSRHFRRGDPVGELDRAPLTLEGVFHCGGQEQFYLESQAAIAYPGEEGQLVVHSSTQNPTEIQAVVSEVLGLGQHQVVCVCKRMGGAFGGKETQATIPALMAALVAQKTRRPARVVYSKDEDMQVTGKRHGYRIEWQVGFDRDGRIQSLITNLYSDGGAAADLSLAVMERSMLHTDNTYFLPHVEINGRVCFTNLPPNTAFRGFGGPQAMAATESIIEQIAQTLGEDSYDVRLRNLYGVGRRNVTPYGQRFEKNHLPEIFSVLASRCQYKPRRDEIICANRQDAMKLRGISLTGVKFGISFTNRFLNQGNALVNVYTDGTVQVSTGGTEMGQGVNTKIRQLVADEFAIPYRHVLVMPTSTEKNNNTSPTAASAGTDLNGAAAVDACRKIRHRLDGLAAQYLASIGDGLTASSEHIAFSGGCVYDRRRPQQRVAFSELVAEARRQRVDLGARGFYATPGVDFNRDTGKGSPFRYFTQGAAVAEVEIDRFTGQLRVPRADLLIDIGRSINPGVDGGQITGGFIQGMGWVTTEALVYGDQGQLLSYSPTTYKIPAITDIPNIFNWDLFPSDDNTENLFCSKAVGEPPLMLAISVWAAVRHALRCLAPDCSPDLRLPATGEEILRCIERLSQSSTAPVTT